MAVLGEVDRVEAWARWQRENDEACGVTKAALRAALDAADAWADANAAGFNAALPLPARTLLSARQKARLLAFVITRRFEVA